MTGLRKPTREELERLAPSTSYEDMIMALEQIIAATGPEWKAPNFDTIMPGFGHLGFDLDGVGGFAMNPDRTFPWTPQTFELSAVLSHVFGTRYCVAPPSGGEE